MSPGQAALLFIAAFVAGVLNSVAGGGSFISFPALLLTGIAPISANASNTAALWPGTVASTWAYRRVLGGEVRRMLPPLIAAALIGGLLGARILLHTPQATFMRLVPWLLLVATLLFVFTGRITGWVRSQRERGSGSHLPRIVAGWFLGLIVASYIGYFGAGAGILFLGVLALIGIENIHAMNGMKTLLVSVANAVALVTFVWAKVIVWPQALLMVVGASIGGYGGAYYAQKMDPQHVRWLVIVVGFAMSLYFFLYH